MADVRQFERRKPVSVVVCNNRKAHGGLRVEHTMDEVKACYLATYQTRVVRFEEYRNHYVGKRRAN